MASNTTAMYLNHTVKTEKEVQPLLLDMDTYFAIESVLGIIILPSVSAFGIFANLANIIVFAKMGFLETTNIMFFALSIADLIIVMIYFIGTFGGNGVFDDINTLFWDMWDLVYLVNPVTWAFVGYSSCATALIAVERSVCIAMPLKVKTIFTPTRITVTLLCFFSFPMANLVIKYTIMELKWVTSPVTNETRLAFVYTEDSIELDTMAALVFSTIPSWISFIVVAIGTAFMVVKLNQSVRWRQASAQSTQKKAASPKEVKVVRSVVIVCSVFIVCFTPNAGIIAASLVYPPFHLSNPYLAPLMFTLFGFSHVLQAISSAMNICIYLSTSTKFKETFGQVFLSTCKKT